jgi:predicted component of type VI protein secretion system
MSLSRIASVVLVALGLWAVPVCGNAADQQVQAPATSPPPQAAPPPSDAIPVAEIAAHAATTTAFLRGLASKLTHSAEIEAIQRALPGVSG